MSAEGIPCETGYPPMHHYDLFQPGLSKLPVPSAFPERFDYSNTSLPEAERGGERESIWLDESVFRAGHKGVDDFVAPCARCRKTAKPWPQPRRSCANSTAIKRYHFASLSGIIRSTN